MSFSVLDWIFGIIILIFALNGLIKGFVDCVFNKLCWILGIILACFFYDYAGNLILANMANRNIANILGFIIVFVTVFLIVKLIQVIVEKIFQLNILKSLDRVLGFAFGIIEGGAVVGLIIFILTKQPFFSPEKLFDGSTFYKLAESFLFTAKEIGTNV